MSKQQCKKKKIIIIGCGEHARMTIDNTEEQDCYEIFGITTILNAELDTRVMGYPVLCKDDEIGALITQNTDITGYILGIGDMKVRHRLVPVLNSILEPVNVIHPAAIISKHAQIGKGNLIEAYTKVANGATLGNHCIINSFSAINHDQTIGNNVLIAGNVSMAGKSIGDNTIVSDGASIGFKRTVGSCCIIGDGAVVTQAIPDNVIAYGNPAKVIRNNDW